MKTNNKILAHYYGIYLRKVVSIQVLDADGNPATALPFVRVTRYKDKTVVLQTIYSDSLSGKMLQMFSPTEFEIAKGVQLLCQELQLYQVY
ncbi:hypothetical protein [Enterococcus sp. AZ109]|uniref:hypothetical protein n=1 Tax=Enterococcus sp. AZ109 TaxID=2774634 RepID=UPI003F280848